MSTAMQAPGESTAPRCIDPLDGLSVQNLDPLVRQVVQRLAVDVAVLRERIGGNERDLRSQESALRELRAASDYNAAIRPEIDEFKEQLQVEMRSISEQCKLEAKALVKVLREEMMSQSMEWRRTNASITSLRSELTQQHAPREDLKVMEARLIDNMHQQAAAIRKEMSGPYSDLQKEVDGAREYTRKVELDVGTKDNSFATKEHVQSYISHELTGVRAEERRLESEVREMHNRLSELEHAVSPDMSPAQSPSNAAARHSDPRSGPGAMPPSHQSPPPYFNDTHSTSATPPAYGASSLNSTAASLPPLKTPMPPSKRDASSPVSKIGQSDASSGPRGTGDLRRELVSMRFTK